MQIGNLDNHPAANEADLKKDRLTGGGIRCYFYRNMIAGPKSNRVG